MLSVTNLAFRVLRDDGVVAYLNGTEIFRMNMVTTGAIFFATMACTATGEPMKRSTSRPTSRAVCWSRASIRWRLNFTQVIPTSDAGFDRA
jgi:hypothetical protein